MKKKKLAWIIGIILALIICCAINEAASTPEEMPNLVGSYKQNNDGDGKISEFRARKQA